VRHDVLSSSSARLGNARSRPSKAKRGRFSGRKRESTILPAQEKKGQTAMGVRTPRDGICTPPPVFAPVDRSMSAIALISTVTQKNGSGSGRKNALDLQHSLEEE